jgi:hypothetical protein
MTRERFVQKLVAYQAWYDAGGHSAMLGIKNFRVLTVAKSEDRLRSLVQAVARVAAGVDLRRFLFVSQTRFLRGPESVLGPIWEGAADAVKLCLWPSSS